ncbi:MAG TPA: WD40 repeat domain-containing protein [Chthoniobacteraceae bacterium]|nr:WD40 repeat domain-containing protein [Chthoniobacteraceae bacterium]
MPSEQSSSAPSEAALRNAATCRNPYVGPRALRQGEQIYGREREARQLFELLIAERVVLLYSPSGAGKTSLIQAALVPQLKQEEFRVLPTIRVSRGVAAGVVPRNPYVMSALLSLEQDVPPERAIPQAQLAEMEFAEYLAKRDAEDEAESALFLIFDQFEEILTFDPLNREAKAEFFNQVGTALRDLERWALFSMREDHVAGLDPYVRPLPTRLKSTFRLDLLTAEKARLAVQGPAHDEGVEFTEEATTKLVDDLREVTVQGPGGVPELRLGAYVEPVQLQVVCFRLWEKLDAGTTVITDAQVTRTGDVDSALADYYAERVRQIAEQTRVKERVIREWFDRRLITESGIRGQVMLGSDSKEGLTDEAIRLLEDVHLVRGEERRGVTWLELAHDRLIQPIRADNGVWSEKNLSILQHQATVWNRQNRSDALCLRAEALAESQEWAEKHAGELTETEREFLEVCERNHDARQSRRLRWIALALAIGMSCIGWFAWQAQRQAHKASARQIAGQAMQLLNERLDTALLLAPAAQERSDLPDTRGSLLTAAYHNPRLITFLHDPPTETGSGSPIGTLAFSPDGAQLVTGGYNKRLVLWQVNDVRDSDGRVDLVGLKDHRHERVIDSLVSDAVRGLAFSPDGVFLAICSKDGSVLVMNRRDEAQRIQLQPPLPAPAPGQDPANMWSVAFSPDSTLLAASDQRGVIHVWDIATKKAIDPPPAFTDREWDIRTVKFHPNRDAPVVLAVGCGEGSIVIWRRDGSGWIESDRRAAEVERGRRIMGLSFSPTGKYLAVGRVDRTASLYELDGSGAKLRPEPPAQGRHDGPVTGLDFSRDGERLISSSFDGTLRLWEVPSMKPVGPPFTGHVGRVFAVAFSRDGRTVASGGTDRKTILWDTWRHVSNSRRAEASEDSFRMAFSPNGVFEAEGYNDDTLMLTRRDRATNTSEPIELVPPLPTVGPVSNVAFSRDSRFLVSSARDLTMRRHDLANNISPDSEPAIFSTGKFAHWVKPKGAEITAVAVSAGGKFVAAAVKADHTKGAILIWNGSNGAPLCDPPLSGPDDEIFALEFSPDGKRLATGGDAEYTMIWNIAEPSAPSSVRCKEMHTGKIRGVAFDPSGKSIVTASGDNTLILWNAHDGSQLAPPLTAHLAPVVSAIFSPNGKLLASGSDDTAVILWDLKTRQPTGRLMGHTGRVRALAFSPDSKQLYSGSWDQETREWQLDSAALRRACRTRANRELTKSEREAYLENR